MKAMKTGQRIAVKYFLRTLEKKMQEQQIPDIHPVWKTILGKKDLKKIVLWLYPKEIPEKMCVNIMDKEELLSVIADEYLILRYLLEQMDKELEAFNKPTGESVQTMFRQLGLSTHYLATKPIDLWDKYDLANYKTLWFKAGNPIPMYAVFHENVREDEKYFVYPISKLHESEFDAQSEVFHHVMEHNEMKVKTMML